MLDLCPETSVPQRTRILQEALDSCAREGGGEVTLPPGDWEISSFHLGDNTTLRLTEGCRLLAATDLELYPKSTNQDANKDRQPYHLLVAENVENIRILGPGCIDGQGPSFWHRSMRELAAEGVDIEAICDAENLPDVYRNPQHPWAREKKQRVSPLVEIKNCRNVHVEDLEIRNSPGWTFHGHNVTQMKIINSRIRNHMYGPNTDGLDLNGCKDVEVSGCDLVCGDDAVIIKAMDDTQGTENIYVHDCVLASNCAAIGLGAECIHPMRNVRFENIEVKQALRAFQIEMWDPGLIEQVRVKNLHGVCHTEIPLQRALYINVGDNPFDRSLLGKRGYGKVRDVIIEEVRLRCRGRSLFTSPVENGIEDLQVRNVCIEMEAIEDPAQTVPAYPSSQMSNHCPEARVAQAGVVAQNVKNLQLDAYRIEWPKNPEVAEQLNQNPINPHYSNPPMKGLWQQGCVDLQMQSPELTDFEGL